VEGEGEGKEEGRAVSILGCLGSRGAWVEEVRKVWEGGPV
jgi:hypothetical protein